MSPGQRGTTAQHAKRVNVAVRLLASGLSVADVARQLARRLAVSERQARRYAEEARDSGSREVPQCKVVFTVKLPAGLVKDLRRMNQASRRTLSSIVSQAIEEFMKRMRGGFRSG
jgi:hypothetical protein